MLAMRSGKQALDAFDHDELAAKAGAIEPGVEVGAQRFVDLAPVDRGDAIAGPGEYRLPAVTSSRNCRRSRGCRPRSTGEARRYCGSTCGWLDAPAELLFGQQADPGQVAVRDARRQRHDQQRHDDGEAGQKDPQPEFCGVISELEIEEGAVRSPASTRRGRAGTP